MSISGVVKSGRKTKDLIRLLEPGDIALVQHRDIDEVAANSLVQARVKALINVDSSSSGSYPNPGPQILMDSGIMILDDADPSLFDRLNNGDKITISRNEVFKDSELLGRGTVLTKEMLKQRMLESWQKFPERLGEFVENTLEYAKKELCLITGELQLPEVSTEFAGRHAVIVVRGKNYHEDLQAIRSYIEEVRPVLVGVDGGGDAIVEFGYKPHMIIGDMDSVSDLALLSGAEIVVHAYPDGTAPGMDRIRQLGLQARVFPAPGMSEDMALLLAFEKGAKLIVAVGSHSNIIDFLEKGRKGMASTFLVRVKIGSILVDAKGVSTLYKGSPRYSYLTQIVLGALLPILGILLVSERFQQLFRLVALKLHVMLGN